MDYYSSSFLLIPLCVCYVQGHGFPWMAPEYRCNGMQPSFLLSFLFFNPCLFLFLLFSLTPPPFTKTIPAFPWLKGESGLSCPVCLFHFNPGTKVHIKSSLGLSFSGRAESHKVSDPVSYEDLGHCPHEWGPTYAQRNHGLGEVQFTGFRTHFGLPKQSGSQLIGCKQ